MKLRQNPKIHPFQQFLVVCIVLLAHAAQAATVSGLYEAIVPIDGYRAANSKQVLAQGMLQVLVKVTGNRDISEHPNISKALEAPDNYLIKYTQKIVETTEDVTQESVAIKTKQLVSIQSYSQARIQDLLKTSDIPIWGKQRPLTLAWIAIEFTPQNRVILNESDDNHFNLFYKNIVNEQVRDRGLPLAYPIQDLEEQLNISSAAIWAQFPEDLRAASTRYGADMILVASLQAKDENTWVGRWKIIGKDNIIEFSTESYQLTSTVQQGVNWLADTLAKVYTTHLAAPTEYVEVKVEGINSLSDYTKLEKYLTSLAVVEKVKLIRINRDALELSILVKQGKLSLLSALELDSKLVKAKATMISQKFDQQLEQTVAKNLGQKDSYGEQFVDNSVNSEQLSGNGTSNAQMKEIMKFRWRS